MRCFESFMSYKCHSVATLRCHWGHVGFPIHTSERTCRRENRFLFILSASCPCLYLPFYLAGISYSGFISLLFSHSCDAILHAPRGCYCTADVLHQHHLTRWFSHGTSPWTLEYAFPPILRTRGLSLKQGQVGQVDCLKVCVTDHILNVSYSFTL